jgi:hypothetical protein
LGEIKRWRNKTTCSPEKGRTHTRWPKKTLRANEGSLGGKKKRRRYKKSSYGEKRRSHTRRTKKAFAIDEGSLGSATESCRAQVTVVNTTGNRRLPMVFSSR